MKKTIINFFATHGIVWVLITIIGITLDGEFTQSRIMVFQILGVNTVIFCGLHFIQKIEFQYAIFEFLLDILKPKILTLSHKHGII